MQPATHCPTAFTGVAGKPDEDLVFLWRRPLGLLEAEHLEPYRS